VAKIHHNKKLDDKVLFNVFLLNHLPNIIINYVNEMLLDFQATTTIRICKMAKTIGWGVGIFGRRWVIGMVTLGV
jgi:hypothetical protein